MFDKLLKNFEDKAAQVRLTFAENRRSYIHTKQDRRPRNKAAVQRILEDTTPPSDDLSTSTSLTPLLCFN